MGVKGAFLDEREEAHVYVRHFEAFDEHAGTEGIEGTVKRVGCLLRYLHEVRVRTVIEVEDVGDGLFSDNEGFAFDIREPVQDNDNSIVLINDLGRQFAPDDLAEYGVLHMRQGYRADVF